jgi:AcrR family transcriptional regulator
MPSPGRQLSTAADRRVEVLHAAVHAFAARGYYGTTTTEVATAAGISQAYLYRLFPDKQALFVAVLDHVGLRMRAALAESAATVPSGEPVAVLAAMHAAYGRLIADRDLLMVFLQGNCAASEPAIRESLRTCYATQVEYIRAASGASDEEIQRIFAVNLLANVMVAIDATTIDAPWAHTLLTGLDLY